MFFGDIMMQGYRPNDSTDYGSRRECGKKDIYPFLSWLSFSTSSSRNPKVKMTCVLPSFEKNLSRL
jgi:hypothetical protein